MKQSRISIQWNGPFGIVNNSDAVIAERPQTLARDPAPKTVSRGFKQRIIITGANRSGTTFLGEILAAAPRTVYAYEPFSPKHGLACIDRWYLYLDEKLPIAKETKEALDNFMAGRGTFRRRPVTSDVPIGRRLFRRCFRSINQFRYSSEALVRPAGTLLIKDPICLLSTNYLCRTYGCQAVVLVRHPCAYYASLKRMGWAMDPYMLLEQSAFAERYLPEYPILADGVYNKDPITAAAHVWLFLYTAAARLCVENRDMIMVRHEDLSLSPFKEVKAVCRALNLPYTPKMKRRIERMTSNRNPVEASQTHSLKRDSARNAFLWREKLKDSEIERIMDICGDLAVRWY